MISNEPSVTGCSDLAIYEQIFHNADEVVLFLTNLNALTEAT
jgi:hypothetical protein